MSQNIKKESKEITSFNESIRNVSGLMEIDDAALDLVVGGCTFLEACTVNGSDCGWLRSCTGNWGDCEILGGGCDVNFGHSE